MEEKKDNAIPVAIDGQKQIVYAIPAKPKPRDPWWKQNFAGLLAIWFCLLTAAYIWVYP